MLAVRVFSNGVAVHKQVLKFIRSRIQFEHFILSQVVKEPIRGWLSCKESIKVGRIRFVADDIAHASEGCRASSVHDVP